jgi:hypothetical protein
VTEYTVTELLKQMAALFTSATPTEIFGEPAGDKDARHRARRKIYLRFGKVVHPDRCAPSDKDLADKAWKRLRELYDLAEAEAPIPKITIQSKKRTYAIDSVVSSDDLSVLYRCTVPDGTSVLMSTCRDARNNDLYRAEARSLRLLRTPDRPEASGFFPYFPEVLDSFEFSENDRVRAANVYPDRPGMYSLDEIKTAYPDGIDPRHVAWIWRQLLMALGYAHVRNVIHGGVLPTHVFVDPAHHDLVLTGWFGSVNIKEEPTGHVPVMLKDFTFWYPREVATKAVPSPATDIAMSARCMIDLLGGNPITGRMGTPRAIKNTPVRLAGLLQACVLPGASGRPQEAWALRKQFTALMDVLWGPRKRVVLDMPRKQH